MNGLLKTSGGALIDKDDFSAPVIPGYVLVGKSYSADGDDENIQVGTMSDNADRAIKLNSGESYVIPIGKHSGYGSVYEYTRAEQTAANPAATSASIWQGRTAWVNGSVITGAGKCVGLNGAAVAINGEKTQFRWNFYDGFFTGVRICCFVSGVSKFQNDRFPDINGNATKTYVGDWTFQWEGTGTWNGSYYYKDYDVNINDGHYCYASFFPYCIIDNTRYYYNSSFRYMNWNGCYTCSDSSGCGCNEGCTDCSMCVSTIGVGC